MGSRFGPPNRSPRSTSKILLEPSFALEVAGSYPDFAEAQTMGREFSAVNEKGKIQIADLQRFPDPVAKLHGALSSQEFLDGMQILSGIQPLAFDNDYAGGGIHITRKSGILDVHVDFSYSKELKLYRRLNVLIYLNEQWNESWGGNVELWDRSVKRRAKSFSPVLNRCLTFATSDYGCHGFTAVTAPVGVARKSFVLYLYNTDSSHFLYGHAGKHSTIFKARPDEKLKRYLLMPAESGWRSCGRLYYAGKQRLKHALGRTST